jgi:hypothetical protein
MKLFFPLSFKIYQFKLTLIIFTDYWITLICETIHKNMLKKLNISEKL